MPITVDAKGNISFTPDDIPAEIPVEELVPTIVPNPTPIDGIEIGIEPDDSIESEESDESEVVIGTQTVRTQLLELYGGMTKEDFLMLFYNQEAPRAADANDESLARMLKEQRMIIEICRIRERVIIEEDARRETVRSRKAKDERKKLDAEYKPQTRIQKSVIEEQQNQAAKAKSQKERDIEKLALAMGIEIAEATELYEKKGKK